MAKLDHIRNVAIIAHIDHGKSTLADRLIEVCGGLDEREMRGQVLDAMDLERERGITIKAQTVRLTWDDKDGESWLINLIDTPGHVDFTYEVSRSMRACEGAILIVDATQGVEAQTVANAYLAIEADLEILPVINKTDLVAADTARTRRDVESSIGIDATAAVPISAKTGTNVPEVIRAIIAHLPPPVSRGEDRPLKALLVDSWYDPYLGVVILVRVFDGHLEKRQKIRMMGTGAVREIDRVGIMTPKAVLVDSLGPGEIGFITAAIKDIAECRIGDTITDDRHPTDTALEGFAPSVPVVFCGLFTTDSGDYNELRESLGKLRLNDASFHFEPENSAALGFGFRCGFLGVLHLEIIQERLEREFGLDLLATAPSVVYRVTPRTGETFDLHNPADLPDPTQIESIEEPWIRATIMVPDTYLGAVLRLVTSRRGEQVDLTYVGGRAMVIYRLPLAEVVFDFHDRLKSVSSGYASFDYHLDGYLEGDLVRIDILVNGEQVDGLSLIAEGSRAEARGRAICEKLKDAIPRQLFKVPIQAAIGGRIIARETLSALRKDVLAKCYGGDVSRKRKLLDRQKRGKKRMRQFGNVEIPQDAFLAALKLAD
ncbi:MAG: translation elongation factor 4 [Alphaproteobacteria bacterium]|nr:translation elongation factor 4 [Alphaproteobacteria bacterium]